MTNYEVAKLALTDGLAGRGKDEVWAGSSVYEAHYLRGSEARAARIAWMYVESPDDECAPYTANPETP